MSNTPRVPWKTGLRAKHIPNKTEATWPRVSYDPHKADHVTQPYRSTFFTVTPQLSGWTTSLWPRADISPVAMKTTASARWVLTNWSVSLHAFRLLSGTRRAWGQTVLKSEWLVVAEVHTSLTGPVVWYTLCKYWQAVDGDSGLPVAVGLPPLCTVAGLLVVFLPQIAPCQRPEWGRPGLCSLSHSLPGEGRHRWRYACAGVAE